MCVECACHCACSGACVVVFLPVLACTMLLPLYILNSELACRKKLSVVGEALNGAEDELHAHDNESVSARSVVRCFARTISYTPYPCDAHAPLSTR